MSQLDSDDVPKTSSTGARHRVVCLIAQLPSQDLATRFCRQLGTDKHQLDAFEQFRRARDTEVIDVAQVTAAIKHRAVSTVTVTSRSLLGVCVRLALATYVDDDGVPANWCKLLSRTINQSISQLFELLT